MAIDETAIQQTLSLLLPSIQAHRESALSGDGKRKLFVLGLSGVQGSGKSTWARSLSQALNDGHHFKTVVLSLDDLYHTHEELVRLRESNPGNSLFRNRGQPGTHDEVLAQQVFGKLRRGEEVALPRFDKGRFKGEGDRVPQSEWERVTAEPPVDILILEGWCVGFQSLSEDELEAKWSAARTSALVESDAKGASTSMLRTHPLHNIRALNENLRRYNATFLGPDHFDFLVHLDTERLANVYRWRIQQEEALRAAKGEGQTNDEVIAFVQVYMPAYELYLERLQREAFARNKGATGRKTQIRIKLGDIRQVASVTEL
ncbi:putative d-glycerate 3-kinase [Rosellinia necatrix]|uniref:Putative d-glycerate 3-kinase n=1 Tax=Rosellinia necatrix TaxID=77044 RepID=A0A1W2TUD8_ROSNE|nr:putative d-glycerate 3-kinase [Rosellinia necatrix]